MAFPKTRRERLKSALYLRLKKAQFLNFLRGDPFDFLKIQSVAKYQKVEGGPFGDILKKLEKFSKKKRKMRFLKQSHSAEKLERGDLLGFLKLQFAAKYQKI